MAKTQVFIGEMVYDNNELLGNEIDVLEEFSSYNGSMYVCDAISELADSYIPIYDNDVWKDAYEISDYIEQAISEGLVDTSDINLVKIFQGGYYCYYTELLNNNLDAIAFNIIANNINMYLQSIDADNLDLDLDEIEEQINDGIKNFDNNSYISDLDEITNDIIDGIKESLSL